MKKYIHNFIHCGILEWCLEILFTAFFSFRQRQLSIRGNTSLWMFPIYGCACFLSPVCKLLKGKNFLIRGLSYASLIFTAEYLTGALLSKKHLCPWDYSAPRWHIQKLIRLDYLPFWFIVGLLFERLLAESDS